LDECRAVWWTEIRIDLAAPEKGQKTADGPSNVPASFPITALASLRDGVVRSGVPANQGKFRQNPQQMGVPGLYVSDAIIPAAYI
jgi:hypothetical protein